MYCCSWCTSLVEVITLYGCSVALHEKDVVIQCILYIKTCHRIYTKIFWDFMRSQGRIPHHHLLNLGKKSSQLKYSYVDKARADIFRKKRKNWIFYHRHLMICSCMLCVYLIICWLTCHESSGGWLSMGIGLAAVAWSTLPTVPKVCLELVACGCQIISLRHASAATLKSAHLPAAAMPKIVVTRHHEFSSIIMDQVVLVTFISQNLVYQLWPVNTSLFWKLCIERHRLKIWTKLFTTWIYIKLLDFFTF